MAWRKSNSDRHAYFDDGLIVAQVDRRAETDLWSGYVWPTSMAYQHNLEQTFETSNQTMLACEEKLKEMS